MADNASLQKAKYYYDMLCRALDGAGLKYQKHEENLTILTGIRGEDIPVECIMVAEAERDMMMFLSKLPFSIPEDKRLEVAVALTAVNDALRDGAFQFDLTDGTIIMRLTASYVGNPLNEDEMLYLFVVGTKIVDEYNDKLLMLSKGMLSLQQFIDSI